MTPDEVETCLREFESAHGVRPELMIANDETHGELAMSLGFAVTDVESFAGVTLLRDPLVKGIVVSS